MVVSTSNQERTTRSIRRRTVFREANDRIRELDEEFGGGRTILLLCECAKSGCLERIEIGAAEYEAVRRFPTRFLVKPGHAAREGERVVRSTNAFVIVEKTGA
jgi:hypothetical protein